MVDWDAGAYETTAAELEPVAHVVVEQARLSAGEDVLDLGCGTGNAALIAAARGARVIGVDAAPRLLGVARERARAGGVDVDFREGDLLDLPVGDAVADVALSVFGVIFATDPAGALGQIARTLRPGGRALLSAWIPAGPIDAMLMAMGQVLGRVGAPPPPRRFAWADPGVVAALAGEAGLALAGTTRGDLAIRAASPEAYLDAGQAHPMAVAARPLIERAGVANEVRDAMAAVLQDANEDPDGLLVHSPYVVHELRAGPLGGAS